MKTNLLLICSVLVIGLGCANLKPGADPVIVRAEQVEQVAFATFDTFVHLVAQHEDEVKERVPAAYQFAEWLRAKGPSGLPRGIALVKSLDTVRKAYKANRTPENKAGVASALAALESALAETQKQIAAVNVK